MFQPIPKNIVAAVEQHGWLVPSDSDPLAEGGGGCVYRCYNKELVCSLSALARSAGRGMGQPVNSSRDLACKALACLHQALIDNSAIAILKVPKAGVGSQRRVRREIDTMLKMSELGFANLLSADDSDPAQWMLMQYYSGGPIAQSRDVFKGNPEAVLRGTLQVARALVKLHEFSLVHRDIKPSNIFLNDKEDWVLGDFGIALDIEGTRLTKTDEVLWSRDWIPDWMIDRPLVDASPVVDLYMLVLTSYSMLTGRKPRASQMDEAEFGLDRVMPDWPHNDLLLEFFATHIVSKEKDVASRSAADLCKCLELLLARIGGSEMLLPLFSFVSSHSMTDVPEAGGRPFTALVMNARRCKRIAVSARGSSTGRGLASVKLTLEKQQHTVPVADGPDAWSMLTGFELNSVLPEGPLHLLAQPSGCTMSGLIVWAR